MKSFQKYVRAKSLEEAYTLNQKKSNRIVGGMLWMKMASGPMNTAIDLCDLGLDQIEETEKEFIIGCMVTLGQLEAHQGFQACSGGAFSKAVKDIVGIQFRNMATVGGSIWGRFGFSDVLTQLLSMDTFVELYKGGRIPLSEFVKQEANRDILVRIVVEKKDGVYTYQSVRAQKTDFPILTCGASRVEGEYRVTIGARPQKAVLVKDIDGMLGRTPSKEEIAQFAAYVAKEVKTGSNLRGSASYRSHLVRVLVERCLLELEDR